MKQLVALFQQKMLYIGLVVVLLVVTLLSFANLGSTVSPSPKDMPVALVVEDKGVQIPGKGEMNFGKTMQEKIVNAPNPNGGDSPLLWTVYGTEQEAQEAIDHEQVYAALILPSNLSERIVSLQGKNPQSADVKVWINQGKNYSGANLAATVFDKLIAGMNTQLREQMLGDIQARGDVMNTAQAKALATPLVAETTNVNAVGTHSANGNAPMVLTQLVWFGSMISSVFLFLSAGKVQVQGRRFGVVLGQVVGGAVLISAAVSMALWIAHGVLGLDVPEFGKTWWYMAFIGYCFFLMQTAVLNWIGLKGMPIFILIFFFGAPVLSLPVEFMPAVTRDWLYSWLPLRFSAEVLRDVLYFGKNLNLSSPAWTLGMSAIVGAVLVLLSGMRKGKATAVQGQVQEQQAV